MITQINKQASLRVAETRSCKASVQSHALADKELLHKAFCFYHNKFEANENIDAYCTKHSLDRTYLGLATGNFYKTVSKKSKAFEHLKALGLLNKDGKDSYANHLVIPTLEDMQVSSLEFVDLNKLDVGEGKQVCAVLPLSENSFRVDLNGRLYQLQGLVKSEHQLKVTLKLQVERFKHIDVVNFYSSGNRKRLLRDVCELFLFPHDDIRADIQKLTDLCENYETQGNPNISVPANELLMLFSRQAKNLSSKEIEEHLLWGHTKAFRALKELLDAKLIQKVSTTRPILYKIREQTNKTFLDLQGLTKSS